MFLIERTGVYKVCKNFGSRPSRFGVIEIQTWSIVQCPRTYSAKNPTRYDGKNSRLKINKMLSYRRETALQGAL